jgi:hypothetical protein
VGTDDEPQNLQHYQPWRFIKLDQFRLPSEPAREKVRRGLLGIWDRLKGGHSAAESPTVEMDLEGMPKGLLEDTVPPPDWGDGVPALQEALQSWLDEPAEKIQLLIGPPCSGTAEIVSRWASEFDHPILGNPPLDQIKARGLKWFETIDDNPDQLWVIPHLECFYLRHSQGFTLLRGLLEKIKSASTRYLLACDSWTWAYFSKALHIDTLFPKPLVLEPFDHEKLEIWFQKLADRAGEKNFIFRQADNGTYIMHPFGMAKTESGEEMKFSDFLPRLAAYSRGIPGVAHIIWRYGLRLGENSEKKPLDASEENDYQRTIWVEPWPRINLPDIPSLDRREGDIFVLHSLLLHNGLSSNLLAQILPFPEPQIQGILHVLQTAGIAVIDQDIWHVAASAYPAVRQFLQNEGYLIDVL